MEIESKKELKNIKRFLGAESKEEYAKALNELKKEKQEYERKHGNYRKKYLAFCPENDNSKSLDKLQNFWSGRSNDYPIYRSLVIFFELHK